MKQYKWFGIDAQGKEHSGCQYARSAAYLDTTLLAQGIVVLNSRPVVTLFTNNDDAPFFLQLATLIDAHIPLAQALGIAAQSTSDKRTAALCLHMKKEVENGVPLSSALCVFDNSSVYSSLVRVGEKTGTLADSLFAIYELLEQGNRLKQQVRKAALLPLITLIGAISIVFGIFIFIVPQLEQFISSMQKPMPLQIARLIAVRSAIISPTFLGCVIIGVVFLVILTRKYKTVIRSIVMQIACHIPILRTCVVVLEQARCITILSRMYSCGIDIKTSILHAADIIRNAPIRAAYEYCHQDLAQGMQLSQSLKRVKRFSLSDEYIAMVRIGEQTGKLAIMLEKMAMQLQRQSSAHLNVLTQLIQPCMLIGVAVLIAIMLWTVYMPLFSMLSSP